MPELPEVQTVVNDLKEKIIGEKIVDFCNDFPKSIKSKNFSKEIVGKKIVSVERRAKNIVLGLSSGKSLLVHLKMTGKLVLRKDPSDKRSLLEEKHVHSIFFFNDGGRMVFEDIRKFGTLEIMGKKNLEKKFSKSGIDPFSKDFTSKKLLEIFNRKPEKKIKAALMDQTMISGLGNIYASEILFDSHINPSKKASSLSKKEISNIRLSSLKILKKSLKFRGTSVSDYRDSENRRGEFQNYLKVYKKNGQKCKKCDTIIEKIIIEQRSTFFCPSCQK